MSGKYDFMVPEDRVQKVAEFESKRQAWISTRSRGKARFVLFSRLLRESSFNIVWGVFYVVYLHASIALATYVIIFLLLLGRLYNLLEWYWNEKRFVTRVRLQPGHNRHREENGL